MPMEQETIKILYIGVFIVMGISLVFVVGQWISTKKAAYVWLIGHLVVLSITIIRWVSFLSNANMQQSHMAAENNSLFIGSNAVLWAIGMFLLLIGIYKLDKTAKTGI